jgi:putative ABC transport system ATP-binding protein
VTKVYGARASAVRALDDDSVSFEAQRFTAVIGPSGSGKTTLSQWAAGIDRPISGRVKIGEAVLGGLSQKQLAALRCRSVGFVFQSLNMLGSLTAEQNVGLPLRLDGRRPKRPGLREALGRVGLGDRAGRRPGELPGGQQQPVAIARALVTDPDVIFADEPTGALDIRSGRAVLDAPRQSVDAFGQTVVMVTHDPAAAARADPVVFMADGRLARRLEAASATQVADWLTQLGD